MALTLNDRVLETCTSPGTGAVTLLGATTGFRTFLAGVGNGNTCYYTIADQAGGNWEVGLGTYTSSSNSLARTTILSSSNSGSLVNFNSGTQNVFVTYPAEKAVYLDASGNVTLTGTLTASAINSTPIGSGTASTGAFTTLSASSTVSGTGFSNYLASPPAIGSGTPNTGAFTTLTASSDFITTTGLYAKGAFSGTFTDGIVVDYVSGTGRISVGSSDGLSIYNGGVAGTALLNLDSSGNLGLGTATAAWYATNSKAIQIGGSTSIFDYSSSGNRQTTVANNAYLNSSAAWTYLSTDPASRFHQTGGQFQWYTAPSGTAGSAISFTQAMTLNASGQLCIGVSGTYGAAILSLKQSAANQYGIVIEASSNDSWLRMGSTGSAAVIESTYSSTAGYKPLSFYTGGSETMRLTSAGYLGIGTSSPQYTLDVNGNTARIQSSGNATLILQPTYGAGASQITFTATGSSAQDAYISSGVGSSSNITFGTGGASVSEKMRLTSAGYLGIGTSSPSMLFNVVGNDVARFENTSNGSVNVYWKNSTQQYSYRLDPNNNGSRDFSIYDDTNGQYVDRYYQGASGYRAFYTVGAERMRLDSSGNLGLGVTPSAWGNGLIAMQLPAYGHITASNTQLNFSVNAYYNGGYKYINTGTASFFNANNNSFTWNLAASGTAGSAISFTQAMTLDASGNLLVAKTGTGISGNGITLLASGTIQSTMAGTGTNYHAIFANNGGTTVGSIYSYGSTTTYATSSDQRLKTNITPAGSAIQSILDFPVDQFDWISSGEHQDFGGVAQKVLPVIPEMVSVPANEEEMLGIDWSKAVPRLIRAYQELHAELQELKSTLH